MGKACKEAVKTLDCLEKVGQHESMGSWIIFSFLSSSVFAFQVTQQTNDVEIRSGDKNQTEISVKEGSSLKFSLGLGRYDIFSMSELKIEDGRVHLKRGQLRLRGDTLQSEKVETPVGTVTVSGGDVLVGYLTDTATTNVHVLRGSALLQAYYREEILNLQEAEKGEFVGVPEGDGPAFDVLLKGRKAIRGHLQGPTKLGEARVAELAAQFDIKKQAVVKKGKPKPKPGQICQEPFAKFNECVWRCRFNPKGKSECQVQNPKVECLRQKCLANGQWGDDRVLKGAARDVCKSSKDSVGPCDY